MIKIITIIIAMCSMATINSMNIPLQPPPPPASDTITEAKKKHYLNMQKAQGDAAARKAMLNRFTTEVIDTTLGNPPPPPSPRPASPKKLATSPVSAALATLRDSLNAVNTNVSNLAQQLNALRTQLTSDATPVENSAKADRNSKPIGSTSIKPNDRSLLLEQIQTFKKSTNILPPEKIITHQEATSAHQDESIQDESIVEEPSIKIPLNEAFAEKLAAQAKKLKKTTPQPNAPLVTEGSSSGLANSEQEEEIIAPSSSIATNTQQTISEEDKQTLKNYTSVEDLLKKNLALYNKLITQGYTNQTIQPFLFTEVDEIEWDN